MLKQLKGYFLETEPPVTSPVKVIKEFLFDIEPPTVLDSGLGLPSSAIVDDGHPLGLGNPKILRKIFQHLPTSDLIQIRRVSLRWNHFACENLRHKLDHVPLRPSIIKSYLKLMRKCFCNPFGSFAIRIERLDDRNVKKFFRTFKSQIIRLRVRIVSEEIPEFTKLLQKLPKLEELHLIRIPEESQSLRREYLSSTAWKYGLYEFKKLRAIMFESDDPSFPFIRNYDTCLLDVINSSPNLVKVHFIDWDSHIANLFRRCGLLNPKSFDGWKYSQSSNPNLREDLEELLFYREMKFKAVKFLIDDTLTFDMVMEMSLKTSETLYHLSLINNSATEIFRGHRKMQRLVTLGLQGWNGPVDFNLMNDRFPNLKTLKLCRNNFREMNGFVNNMNGGPLSSLNSLSILPLEASQFTPIDEEIVEKISQKFPKINELYVHIGDNDTLHAIYEGFPQLELLGVDIRGQNISDEAFTGIPSDTVTFKESFQCGCPRFVFPDESRRPTHIGCLKKLKILIIRAGKNISNLSLMEGICNLKQLEALWLLSSYEPEFEDLKIDQVMNHKKAQGWCLRAMADRFKNLKHLVTSSEIEYTEDDMNYLRERLPALEHETRL